MIGVVRRHCRVGGLPGVRLGGPARDDYTGLARPGRRCRAAGRSRPSGCGGAGRTGSRLRRYLRRGLVTVAGLLLALQVGHPMANAYVGTHLPSPSRPLVAALGPGHGAVEIVSDGRGHPTAGTCRPAIGPPSSPTLTAARRAGPRPFPGSDRVRRAAPRPPGARRQYGRPEPYGWGEHRDIAAAIAFLRGRTDLDPERIGGIGFSVGGEVLLEAAARTSGLRAVVAEGSGFRSVREFRHLGLNPPMSLAS